MSYNKMKIAVGIFAILFIVITCAFFLFILNEKGLFERKYPFAFYADNASCFSLGTPITYVGFTIGSIEKIELTYDGKVFAHFTVSKKYRQLVNKKSFLMLKKPLIGSPVIALVSEPNNTMLHPHAILQFTVQDDINDLVVKFEPIVKKLQEIITSIDTITTRMADPNGPFFQTLANIEKTSHTIADHDSVINALTGDRESAQNIAAVIKSLKRSMERTEKILGEANENIIRPSKEISRNINEILIDIKQKLQRLDGLVTTIGSSGQDIDLLKEQILLTMDKSNILLEKIDTFLQKSNKKVTLP